MLVQPAVRAVTISVSCTRSPSPETVLSVDQQAPRQWPEPADEYEEKLTHDVREFGWHVIGIPDDDVGPGFVYSIGLTERLAIRRS